MSGFDTLPDDPISQRLLPNERQNLQDKSETLVLEFNSPPPPRLEMPTIAVKSRVFLYAGAGLTGEPFILREWKKWAAIGGLSNLVCNHITLVLRPPDNRDIDREKEDKGYR